jgi:PhoH-like ATPase
MSKLYVFDTSILVFDPQAFDNHADCAVVVPIAVLDELDNLKKRPGEVGRNARVAIRYLDRLGQLGDLSVGVLTEKNTLVSVDVADYPLKGSNPLYGDNRIISCAYALSQSNPLNQEVVLISNDAGLRVRAKALGIEAESLETKERSVADLYSGILNIEDKKLGNKLRDKGILDIGVVEKETSPNQCFVFSDKEQVICLGRRVGDRIKLVEKNYPWKLKARNQEQELAIDLMLDPNLSMVSLVGSAGSGKSLISLAVGLEMVLNRGMYQKLIIYRPIQVAGNEIGYIPGTIEEKIAPHFAAIMDSFEVLFSMSNTNTDKWKNSLEMYRRKERIQLEAITYIRGRSIPNALIILDEGQNLGQIDIKTVLTRLGEGSKIIITGDLEQIDAPHLDATNNGLIYAIERLKHSPMVGHITLTKGERSPLATEAAKCL